MKFFITIVILCVISVHHGIEGIGESKVREPCSVLGLKFNETVQLPDTCAPYRCNEGDKIELQNCGVIATEPPCGAFPGNVTLPFPDCCWEIKCYPVSPRPTPRRPKTQE